MKILLIRHAEVAMKWERRYTSREYDEACERYDMADIEPAVRPEDMGDYRRIYVSTLKRSVQTREYLFPYASEQMVTQTPLLDEVPLRAYDDSPKIRPRWMYDLAGRLQWRIGGGSGQPETAAQTKARADALIDLLEERNENAILITHGFFMGVLISRFKKRKRYEVFRGSTFVIRPLEKIRIMDRQPHCGGCHHNCQLSAPRCDVGRNKAKEKGVRIRE